LNDKNDECILRYGIVDTRVHIKYFLFEKYKEKKFHIISPGIVMDMHDIFTFIYVHAILKTNLNEPVKIGCTFSRMFDQWKYTAWVLCHILTVYPPDKNVRIKKKTRAVYFHWLNILENIHPIRIQFIQICL
jgi:hypothetical protein